MASRRSGIVVHPYIRCLLQKFRRRRCYNCFSTRNIKQCFDCNLFFYCSINCRMVDAESGHKVECGLLTRSGLSSHLCFEESDEGDLTLLLLRVYSTTVMLPNLLDETNPNKPYPMSFNQLLDMHKTLRRTRHDEQTQNLCTAIANHINSKNPSNPIDAYTLMNMADVVRSTRFGIVDNISEQQVGWGLHVVPQVEHENHYHVIARMRGLSLQPLKTITASVTEPEVSAP